MPDQILEELEEYYRRPEVEKISKLYPSSIYRLMAEGEFPRPVRIGKKAVAWTGTGLREWQKKRQAS